MWGAVDVQSLIAAFCFIILISVFVNVMTEKNQILSGLYFKIRLNWFCVTILNNILIIEHKFNIYLTDLK